METPGKHARSTGKWVAILAAALGIEIGLCAVVPSDGNMIGALTILALLTLLLLVVAFILWLFEIVNPGAFR
jgi:hypothetical protein